MSRNFGLKQYAERFWNEQTGELHGETRWAFIAIGASVLLILAFAVFFN